jgi:hypothetical protein
MQKFVETLNFHTPLISNYPEDEKRFGQTMRATANFNQDLAFQEEDPEQVVRNRVAQDKRIEIIKNIVVTDADLLQFK